jgi:excisionase family DNA binding protein
MEAINPVLPEVMTMQEVADLFSVHRTTIHKMRERGEITAYKFAKRVYFLRSEIMATVRSNRVEVNQEETSQAA